MTIDYPTFHNGEKLPKNTNGVRSVARQSRRFSDAAVTSEAEGRPEVGVAKAGIEPVGPVLGQNRRAWRASETTRLANSGSFPRSKSR